MSINRVKVAYKLFRQRKDGTLGPLFIDRKRVIPLGPILQADDIPTKGYAHRPGWHLTEQPIAPHLSAKGRVWAEVEFWGGYYHDRPKHQGGRWIIADRIRVVRILPKEYA